MITSLYAVREALPRDTEAIAELEEELFPENWMSACSILNELARGVAFVYPPEGTIAAYAITSYSNGVLDLLRLGVTAQVQGKGIGRMLLRRVLDVPHRYCILTVKKNNRRAVRLYRSEGFVLYGELEDSVVLTRTSSLYTPARKYCT